MKDCCFLHDLHCAYFLVIFKHFYSITEKAVYLEEEARKYDSQLLNYMVEAKLLVFQQQHYEDHALSSQTSCFSSFYGGKLLYSTSPSSSTLSSTPSSTPTTPSGSPNGRVLAKNIKQSRENSQMFNEHTVGLKKLNVFFLFMQEDEDLRAEENGNDEESNSYENGSNGETINSISEVGDEEMPLGYDSNCLCDILLL